MSTKTSSKAVCGDSVSFNRSRRRDAMLGGLTSSVCLQKCAIIIISLLEAWVDAGSQELLSAASSAAVNMEIMYITYLDALQ